MDKKYFLGHVSGRDRIGNIIVQSPKLPSKVVLSETGSTIRHAGMILIYDEHLPGRSIVFKIKKRGETLLLGDFVHTAYPYETDDIANERPRLCQGFYDLSAQKGLLLGYWHHASEFFAGRRLAAGVVLDHKYALLACDEATFDGLVNGTPIQKGTWPDSDASSLLLGVHARNRPAGLLELLTSQHSSCSL